MAQSAVDVCNSALQRVGAATIMSLTDNSREARACSVAYDSNRRDELRKRPWNFAIKRVVLAPDTAAPAFGYTHQFTLPVDCLRVLLPSDATLDWAVEGKKILTNFASSPANVGSSPAGSVSLALKYVADIEDVTQWDASFYNVMAASLAIDIVEVLTQSNQKHQILQQDYKEAVSLARVSDAFENLPADPPDDSFWLARF